jgi:hypothetical protein
MSKPTRHTAATYRTKCWRPTLSFMRRLARMIRKEKARKS